MVGGERNYIKRMRCLLICFAHQREQWKEEGKKRSRGSKRGNEKTNGMSVYILVLDWIHHAVRDRRTANVAEILDAIFIGSVGGKAKGK